LVINTADRDNDQKLRSNLDALVLSTTGGIVRDSSDINRRELFDTDASHSLV